MGLDTDMIYHFAKCELDLSRHHLKRHGQDVHVEPQVFALLALLAERAGDVVSKDEMMARVWKGQIVSEATVSARISAARAAVGDTGRAQAVIRTVPRVGLQLVAPVTRTGAAPAPTPEDAPSAPTLTCKVRMATSADGAGLAWSAIGEGAPLLRAGHWMTHQELDLENPVWRPWIDRLSRGRCLVRYDPRGTGMSDRSCDEVSLEKLVEDMSAVADAAGLEKFSIFAASQSASVACIYAARNPERVDKLILHGAFAQGSEVRDGAVGTAITLALSEMILKGWGQPRVGAMRSFSSLFLSEASEEQVQSFIDLQVASSTPEWAARLRGVCSKVDVTDILNQVAAPVLVTHALHDSLQPFSQAQLFARLLPDATLLGIDSSNHILVPDEPGFERLMDAVDAFLV